MKNKVSSIVTHVTALALFATPLSLTQVSAQEVYSQIVGAIAIDVPAASDVVVAFPFNRSAGYRGPVESSTANTIVFGNPVFADTDYSPATGEPPAYFVYIESDDATSGNKAGRRYDILSNTDSVLTVDADDAAGLSGSGDIVSIREHWTLGEAFPGGVGFVEEVQVANPQVELIMPEKVSQGGGLAADRVFYYYDGHWSEIGEDHELSANSVIIKPGSSFILRNNGSEDLRSYFFGEVVSAPLAISIVADAGVIVDNFVSIERPLSLALDELGLESVMGSGDSLLVYSTDQKNPVSTAYEYAAEQWQMVGSTVDVGDTVIKAGQGIAIRKAVGAADSVWINTWSLPQ